MGTGSNSLRILYCLYIWDKIPGNRNENQRSRQEADRRSRQEADRRLVGRVEGRTTSTKREQVHKPERSKKLKQDTLGEEWGSTLEVSRIPGEHQERNKSNWKLQENKEEGGAATTAPPKEQRLFRRRGENVKELRSAPTCKQTLVDEGTPPELTGSTRNSKTGDIRDYFTVRNEPIPESKPIMLMSESKCSMEKNGFCSTHQVQGEKFQIPVTKWKDRGGGRGFGNVTRKITKYRCKFKNSTLVDPKISTRDNLQFARRVDRVGD